MEKKNVEDLKDQIEELEGKIGEKETAGRFDRVTVKLSKPMSWAGEEYTEIVMKFDELTGEDMEALDDELQQQGTFVVAPTASRIYLRHFAARAARVPSDMIRKLPAKEYNRITTAARNFLTFSA